MTEEIEEKHTAPEQGDPERSVEARDAAIDPRDGAVDPRDASPEDGTEQQDRAYLPYTEDPSASLDAPHAAEAPAEERIARLYERMGSVRRILDAILAFCREPHTIDEVAAEVAPLRAAVFSVYETPSLCELLERAGALEEIAAPKAQPKVVEVDGVSYLQPAEQPEEPSRLRTTEAGAERLAHDGSLERFEAVLAEDGRHEHIYRILLDCCANEGGASAKQMSDAVDADPELQEPRMYASYFFDRLSACGLIEWDGAWKITELGRAAIELLDGRA